MAVGVNGKVRFGYMDEVLRNLGGIPAKRVRIDPPPGTATVRDLIRLWKIEGKMCELVFDTVEINRPIDERLFQLPDRQKITVSNLPDYMNVRMREWGRTMLAG